MSQYTTVAGTPIATGDTVAVHQKIVEGDKTRIQIFEGVVIAIANRETGRTFTVRKIATNGIGVERIYPVHSPSIEQIINKQAGQVKRAKLFYLRQRIGKAASTIKKKILPVQTA